MLFCVAAAGAAPERPCAAAGRALDQALSVSDWGRVLARAMTPACRAAVQANQAPEVTDRLLAALRTPPETRCEGGFALAPLCALRPSWAAREMAIGVSERCSGWSMGTCFAALLATEPDSERAAIERFVAATAKAPRGGRYRPEDVIAVAAQPDLLAAVAARPWLQEALAPVLAVVSRDEPPLAAIAALCALQPKAPPLEKSCAEISGQLQAARQKKEAEEQAVANRWRVRLFSPESLEFIGALLAAVAVLLATGARVPSARRIAHALVGAGSGFLASLWLIRFVPAFANVWVSLGWLLAAAATVLGCTALGGLGLWWLRPRSVLPACAAAAAGLGLLLFLITQG